MLVVLSLIYIVFPGSHFTNLYNSGECKVNITHRKNGHNYENENQVETYQNVLFTKPHVTFGMF